MKVEKILEYQKLDGELFKIEKRINENENKKRAEQLQESMKISQERSVRLEQNAKELLNKTDEITKQCKIQEDKLNEFLSMNIEKMSKNDVEKLNNLKDKLNQNLTILEKNLATLAENMNAILADFNKTIKTFNNARDEYIKRKNAYEAEIKSVENDKLEIKKQLSQLALSVDADIMEAYKKKRSERVFPVLVPLKGKFCGGCNTELPLAILTNLSKDGIITCEHCRRLVYVMQQK